MIIARSPMARAGRAGMLVILVVAALIIGAGSGCSKKSDPTGPVAPAPYAVTDLAVMAGSDSSVTLAWTAPRNPAGDEDRCCDACDACAGPRTAAAAHRDQAALRSSTLHRHARGHGNRVRRPDLAYRVPCRQDLFAGAAPGG